MRLLHGRAAADLLWQGRRVVAGAVAAALGHELRNVMAVVLGGIDYLGREKLTPRAAAILRHVHDAADRGVALARDLTRRADVVLPGTPETCDLRQLAAGVVGALRDAGPLRGRRVAVKAAAPLPARVSVPLVRQVLIELLANAAAATGARGRIEVHALAGADGAAVLEVHDDGPGFKDTPEPDGIGLLCVRVCIRMHGGRVDFAVSPLGGACVAVHLPGAA